MSTIDIAPWNKLVPVCWQALSLHCPDPYCGEDNPVEINLEDLTVTPYPAEREFRFKLPKSEKEAVFVPLDGHLPVSDFGLWIADFNYRGRLIVNRQSAIVNPKSAIVNCPPPFCGDAGNAARTRAQANGKEITMTRSYAVPGPAPCNRADSG
jgi:hypothetical protein